MFEHLAAYRVVCVSGPQRSGTRICAKMIAYDTGLTYVDETAYHVHEFQTWMALVEQQSGLVIQCPAMSRKIHLAGGYDDVAIVWMEREVDDILASQQRIKWDGREIALYDYGQREGLTCVIKYEFFETQQARLIEHLYRQPYEALRAHPLWVEKEQRINFAWDQTEIGK